jgi:hypothetical protein
MNTRVFIFNNASRAANYGIGTYVRQLSDGLAAMPNIKVSFVEMYADTKEFAISEDERGMFHYRIPSLSSNIESEVYCRSIFYLIARNIEVDKNDRLVFQFNYFQHRPLASMLKDRYPYSRIILTVHYFDWCFELKGNITKMRKIIAKGYEAKMILNDASSQVSPMKRLSYILLTRYLCYQDKQRRFSQKITRYLKIRHILYTTVWVIAFVAS